MQISMTAMTREMCLCCEVDSPGLHVFFVYSDGREVVIVHRVSTMNNIAFSIL